MNTRLVEVTDGAFYGKFLVAQFDEAEWRHEAEVFKESIHRPVPYALLDVCGWSRDHLLVLDLETGNGTIFRPGGHLAHDMEKRQMGYVCPLYRPFLGWLYEHAARTGGIALDDIPAILHMGPFMTLHARESPG
jgi:hypothetical protein